MQADRHGVRVSTEGLRAFLTDDRLIRDGDFKFREGLPCKKCGWDVGAVMALHCNRKRPECLDVSQCACLSESFRERVRNATSSRARGAQQLRVRS